MGNLSGLFMLAWAAGLILLILVPLALFRVWWLLEKFLMRQSRQDEAAANHAAELKRLSEHVAELRTELRAWSSRTGPPVAAVTPPVATTADNPPPSAEATPKDALPEAGEPMLQHPVFAELDSLLKDASAPVGKPAAAKPSPLPEFSTKIFAGDRKPHDVQPQFTPFAAPRRPGRFETAAQEALSKLWSWLVVGEEFRRPGVAAEYAIATAWLVRGAAIIMLAGIVFLLKYSMAHGMLPPVARVGLALTAGLAFLLSGWKLASGKYRQIGVALVGMGIVTFYFAVYAASVLYHLMDMKPALVLMTLVTLASGVLAVRTNALLVAVLGVVGGYLTPVLLTTGVKNLPGLYGYLLLIGVGTLYVAFYRNWRLIHYLSFVGTWGLLALSVDKFYRPELADFVPTFGFMTAFFVLFSIQPLLYLVKSKLSITWLELTVLGLNAGVYFGEGCRLIQGMNFGGNGLRWTAALSLGMTAYYLLQLGCYRRLKLKDGNLYNLLLALAIFALTVTFPLLLSGEAITAAWAIQAPLLLWLSVRANSRLVRFGAYLVYALVIGRVLVFDLHGCFLRDYATYGAGVLARLTTLGLLTASLAAGCGVLRRQGPEAAGWLSPKSAGTEKNLVFWVGFVALFGLLHVEFYHFSGTFYRPALPPLLTLVWGGALLFTVWRYRVAPRGYWLGLSIFFAVGLAGKFLLVDARWWELDPLNHWMYASTCCPGILAMRALSALPAVLLLGLLFRGLPEGQETRNARTVLGGGALLLLFLYLTLELNFLLRRYAPDFCGGGISVLWGVYALGLVLGGIVGKLRRLRHVGLLLFGITAVKIFLFDLSHLGAGARIVAFILLGLVLLAAAGIYIKFGERFVTDNESAKGGSHHE